MPIGATRNPVQIVASNWFNPNLDYIWFTVPSLVVIITLQMAVNVTSMSVAREREMGTFDQLLVSPLGPLEIMAGKTIPAFLIALTQATSFWWPFSFFEFHSMVRCFSCMLGARLLVILGFLTS